MNPHALAVLEFHGVLETVAGRALSPLGRDRILELRPDRPLAAVQAELRRVEELALFLGRHRDWIAPEIPDSRAGLKRLSLEGNVLEPVELFAIGRLLGAGRELDEGLAKAREELPGLGFLREDLHRDRGLEKTILRVVDGEGSVLDTASKALGRIRANLRRAHIRIVQALENYLKTLPERIVLADASVTIRDGRYVVPIRREGKGEVGGVVLDESATGATVFVEPPVAQQLMNDLRALERDEAREVHRILREQTEALRPRLPLLAASQEALVVFDTLWARARAALAWEGRAPLLLPPGGQELTIIEGRHPLLLARERGEGEVVPFHLTLGPGERAMVVSGPNTGGKSVFLKALGLISTLAQSGVIPPVGEGTRLPFFSNVFADIGDEQSIAESLSTFSAHLSNLKEILLEADGGSLVLIDEMGTGTDPQEGAALSRAVIETLVDRGALTVATSHLGALKRLDVEGSGIVNASLQFDPDRIEPTYQLQKGRPGRSYGLAIARRLGFPPDVLDRAEVHLPKAEARMEELLSTLERKEREASSLVDSLSSEKARADRLTRELEEREKEVLDRERSAEHRAKEEARRLLLEARQEVEAAIREVRVAAAGHAEDTGSLAEASLRARRRVEEAARRHRTRPGEKKQDDSDRIFQPGDQVALDGSGAAGRVVEIREGRVVVEAAGIRLQVAPHDLLYQGPAPEHEESGRDGAERTASSWQGPEAEAEPEADLRGMRVAEVDLALDRALDQAILGGLGELRVIHGKGTGALRERVAELLGQDRRVLEFRLGLPSEGGGGVTVVKFR
ncbi:MAG: endonuclease MutS2 [Longimicrobiales bacterium]